jgi:ADP-ribose pyrophosphatase
MEIQIYPLDSLNNYRFVVIFAKYGDKWLLTRHKERTTWEAAGGHIEIGETTLEAAKRELYEETGAIKFTIKPVFDYTDGQVFLAEITELGDLPDSEMAEVKLFDTAPQNLTYPQIFPILFSEIEKVL